MRFSLNIDYPLEKMEKSKKILEVWPYFKYFDRVPVGFCIVPRFFTRVFGIDYRKIFEDVETHYYWLLQFAKYQIENIPCDFCTEPVIYVHPYFDNVIASSAFGVEVAWPENETLQAIPTMKDVSEIESFKIPEPDAGLCGKTIEWWLKMKELAGNTEITFNSQKGRVEIAPLTLLGLGPHMIAVDLVGTDFYWWMLEYPDECHRLLDKITKGLISIEENARKIDSKKQGPVQLAEDSAQIMSDAMFREFTVPYDKILYERFGSGMSGSRGMHMCGNSIHLHKTLVEDLKISSFNNFGSLVPPEVAARNMGGKVFMSGNIDPVLMKNGTKQEVKKACMEALEAIAPYGGFILSDGANVCPGTPLENLAAFTEASEEYAARHPELFQGEK
ncbi:MAG: hypothetical protein FIA99_02630 [Ruminiclostridium sp.]|nr:hypothetical protein [Ruminiclostridium sp.]